MTLTKAVDQLFGQLATLPAPPIRIVWALTQLRLRLRLGDVDEEAASRVLDTLRWDIGREVLAHIQTPNAAYAAKENSDHGQ